MRDKRIRRKLSVAAIDPAPSSVRFASSFPQGKLLICFVGDVLSFRDSCEAFQDGFCLGVRLMQEVALRFSRT